MPKPRTIEIRELKAKFKIFEFEKFFKLKNLNLAFPYLQHFSLNNYNRYSGLYLLLLLHIYNSINKSITLVRWRRKDLQRNVIILIYRNNYIIYLNINRSFTQVSVKTTGKTLWLYFSCIRTNDFWTKSV